MGINKKLVELLSTGIALHSSGIYNWAFKKDQALLVLDEIRKINEPILGGDVFLFEDELLVPSCENWSCDQLNQETYDEYVLRSVNVAKSYIEKMQMNGKVPYFVLVPLSDFVVETDEKLNELKELWKKNGATIRIKHQQ